MYSSVLRGGVSILCFCLLCNHVVDINCEDGTGGPPDENFNIELSLGNLSAKPLRTLHKELPYYAFEGIPYAEPPVGDLRFMAPVPHKGWKGVLPPIKKHVICPQYNFKIKVNDKGFVGREDCLLLNIYTPQTPNDDLKNMPILFFMEHLFYKETKLIRKEFSPDYFMEENVIIVTMTHRLSILGFMNLEDKLVPGNMGLRDVILALQWVRDNINHFGGDPASVTLFGHEGGAVNAELLATIKQAKGLFKGIIAHSGTVWNSVYFPTKPKERLLAVAKEVNVTSTEPHQILKDFASISAEDIINFENRAIGHDEGRKLQSGLLPFSPTVDDASDDPLILKRPEENLLEIDVPILMGFNSRSGIEYCTRYLNKPSLLTYAERDFLFQFPVKTNFHFDIEDDIYADALQEVRDFFFVNGTVKPHNPSEYVTYIGEILHSYPMDYAVKQYAKYSKAPVYYYKFNYSGKLNRFKTEVLYNAVTIDDMWGASLGDELCYLFICKEIKPTYEKILRSENQEDITVLRRMVRMWSNFARSGNPTPDYDEFLDNFQWEPATAEAHKYLHINNTFEMDVNPNKHYFDFIDEFNKFYEALAEDGIVQDSIEKKVARAKLREETKIAEEDTEIVENVKLVDEKEFSELMYDEFHLDEDNAEVEGDTYLADSATDFVNSNETNVDKQHKVSDIYNDEL